jgi:hypothetical protein
MASSIPLSLPELRAATSAPVAVHVAALTILDAATLVCGEVTPATQMLLAVRSPETNADHPLVASVPTQRLPAELFRTVVEALPVTATSQGVQLLGGRPVSNEERLHVQSLTHVVEGILARKLGLADALESRAVSFVAEARVIKTGASPVLRAGDRGEVMSMLNVLVYLRSGRDLVPRATASYCPIGWISVGEFLEEAVKEKTVRFHGETRETRYMCAGLCICTADLLLNALPSASLPRSPSPR